MRLTATYRDHSIIQILDEKTDDKSTAQQESKELFYHNNGEISEQKDERAIYLMTRVPEGKDLENYVKSYIFTKTNPPKLFFY